MNGGEGLRAILVTVGDELLLGETVNTNAAWLGARLAEVGVPVVRTVTVGDEEEGIRKAVSTALEEADLVILTGGLGPTPDDRTREAVSSLLGRGLRLDPALLEGLRERYRSRGVDRVPEAVPGMARVPEGAELLPNPLGAAPGLLLEVDDTVCVLLPGIPREMRAIVGSTLLPRLQERFAGRLRPVLYRTIHTTGIPESALAGLLRERLGEDTGPVSVAFLPDLHGVRIRLTCRGMADVETAEAWLDRIEERVAPVVAPFRFEAESGDLAEAVARRLSDRGRTVAVAESCTGGLLGKRLTDRPGASAFFLGGIVAYADRVKEQELGVAPELLRREGAVSRAVAGAMARGVRERLGADLGLSVTGIAGPSGGGPEKPVGTVWFGLASAEGTETRVERFGEDRETIRERAAQAALAFLHRILAEGGA